MCLKRNLTLTLNYQQLISNKENQAALNVHVLLEVNSHSTYKHSRVHSLKDCNRQQMTKLSLSVQHRSENSEINPGGQFLKEILNEKLILLEERRYNL